MMQTIFRAGIEADDEDDHGEDDGDDGDYGGDNIDDFESERVKKEWNLIMPGKCPIQESQK